MLVYKFTLELKVNIYCNLSKLTVKDIMRRDLERVGSREHVHQALLATPTAASRKEMDCDVGLGC